VLVPIETLGQALTIVLEEDGGGGGGAELLLGATLELLGALELLLGFEASGQLLLT